MDDPISQELLFIIRINQKILTTDGSIIQHLKIYHSIKKNLLQCIIVGDQILDARVIAKSPTIVL